MVKVLSLILGVGLLSVGCSSENEGGDVQSWSSVPKHYSRGPVVVSAYPSEKAPPSVECLSQAQAAAGQTTFKSVDDWVKHRDIFMPIAPSNESVWIVQKDLYFALNCHPDDLGNQIQTQGPGRMDFNINRPEGKICAEWAPKVLGGKRSYSRGYGRFLSVCRK